MSQFEQGIQALQTSYQRALDSAALFDISDRGKLEVIGSDAPTFLHNLCTNDIVNLPLGGGCEAFFATAKAKAIAFALIYHVRVTGGRDALWLDVDALQTQLLIQHLDRHLISEQVELVDRTDEFSEFHLAGPQAKTLLASAVGESIPDLGPLEHMERTIGPTSTCHIRRHDSLALPGYDIVCLESRSADVVQRLEAAGAISALDEVFEVLRVEAGMPQFGKDIDENRFVVEVGRKDAINFTKGCYLGQEPIVMARDRAGHVNRSFRGLRLGKGALPDSGTKLISADGKEAGVITSSARSPRFGGIALGYVRRGFEQDRTRLFVDSLESGYTATVTDLPFRAS